MVKNLTSAKSTKKITPNKKTTPLLLFFILFGFQLLAQIPAGYYDAASGQSGDQLKASLHNIIKGHTSYPYTSSSTDVWDILKDADRDPNNSANVIGIYSGFSMDAAAEYASGSGWNREHVWAKSRGDFGTTQGAGTDCHHLRAADISTNSARNNRNFDYADNFYIDGSGNYSGATESKTSSGTYVWEPRDEVKGDVARMIFYMATRYEGDAGEPDLELTETLLDNVDKSPVHARLSVLLEWHQLDPVSDAERSRNDIIYGYQNNRNPFIDHPEFVCLIYACDGGPVNTAPSFTSTAVTSITAGDTYQYNITVSDAEADPIRISATTLPSWLSITDNGNGTALLSGVSTASEVGTHAVTLEASDVTLNTTQSFTITVNAVGTGGGNGTASDLFISEYIEGSSFNKGIEIANYTGASVDLTNYSLFKQTNGAGTWSSELALSGSLADGEVYVIVHSSANATMQSQADLSTGVAAMSFNGNDPVALFKNGSLLDELGVFNNAADFAKDVTLVRKATITSPNTTYNASEWETLATDTFTDLGIHTINLGTGTSDTEAPTVPQNVQVSNVSATAFDISWNAANDNVGVVNYGVYLDGSLIATTANISYSFTGLASTNTYLINIVANDAAGNSSAQSSTVSVTTSSATDTESPSIPQNVQVSNVTATTFDISWVSASDNVGVVNYGVYLDGSLVATTANTSYSFTGLAASNTYLINIAANDAAGNSSAQSSTISVTTSSAADTEAPSIPQNVQVTNVNATSFTINWAAATDNIEVTSYQVYMDGALLGSTVNTSFDISGLSSGSTYLINVLAKDAAGNSSAQSSTISVTTSSAIDTKAPTAPANLAADFVGVNSASINWTASSDNVAVTEYKLYLDGLLVDQLDQLNYTFLGLNEATTYQIGVAAVDQAGNTSMISGISITTNTSQVQGPQIISESYFESGWDDWVSGGNNAIYYSGSYAYEGNSAIRITDDSGLSSSMNTVAFDVNNYNQLSFEFYFYSNRMDYGDQFEIEYFDGQNWNTISTFTEGIDFNDRGFYVATVYVDRNFYSFPQNAQFRIQGLADNRRDQLYFDQITITGLISDSSLRQTSKGLLTTIEKVAGEVSVVTNFSVFPNPSTSAYIQIRKEFEEETEVSLSLYDSKGNLLYQTQEIVTEGYYQPVVNVGDLKAGVYFIKLTDQLGSQEIEKVIIR